MEKEERNTVEGQPLAEFLKKEEYKKLEKEANEVHTETIQETGKIRRKHTKQENPSGYFDKTQDICYPVTEFSQEEIHQMNQKELAEQCLNTEVPPPQNPENPTFDERSSALLKFMASYVKKHGYYNYFTQVYHNPDELIKAITGYFPNPEDYPTHQTRRLDVIRMEKLGLIHSSGNLRKKRFYLGKRVTQPSGPIPSETTSPRVSIPAQEIPVNIMCNVYFNVSASLDLKCTINGKKVSVSFLTSTE